MIDTDIKILIIDSMSNIFETCRIFNLTSGMNVEGIEGTGIPYEKILENLGMFDILENMQTSPESHLYKTVYEFIEEFLTVE